MGASFEEHRARAEAPTRVFAARQPGEGGSQKGRGWPRWLRLAAPLVPEGNLEGTRRCGRGEAGLGGAPGLLRCQPAWCMAWLLPGTGHILHRSA